MRLICIAALTALICVVAWAAESSYLADLPDMPLAPGLVEVAAEGVAFDKPEGRIVVAVAEGKASSAMVTDFYRQSLPPLGWARQGKESSLRFSREGETLTITVAATATGSRVRFELEP